MTFFDDTYFPRLVIRASRLYADETPRASSHIPRYAQLSVNPGPVAESYIRFTNMYVLLQRQLAIQSYVITVINWQA